MDFHWLPHYLRMSSGSGCNHGFSLPTGLSAHALLFRLKSSIFHWLPNYLRMRSRSVENRRSKFSCSRWIKYKLFINMLTWWYNSEYALPDGTILNMLTWWYNSEYAYLTVQFWMWISVHISIGAMRQFSCISKKIMHIKLRGQSNLSFVWQENLQYLICWHTKAGQL